MTGESIKTYLKTICESLDSPRLSRALLTGAVPVTMGFAVACYGVPYDDPWLYDNTGENCINSIDDDGDGAADCDDSECAGLELCLGCGDGLDNDGDGRADCADASCQAVPPCATRDICGDSVDNDDDGLTDCDDPDCDGAESCVTTVNGMGETVGGCSDGIDNNGDGLTDCDDPHCAGTERCIDPWACGDWLDNDADGAVDCEDLDCVGDPSCNYDYDY